MTARLRSAARAVALTLALSRFAGEGERKTPYRAVAARVRLLRRFAPADLVDAGIRKGLNLDTPSTSLPRTPALGK